MLIKPRHTIISVARSIAEGLLDGSIELGSEHSNESASAEEVRNALAVAKEVTENILALIPIEGATVKAEEKDGNILLDIEGEELGLLIGRRGITLDAVQYIVKKIVNKITGSKIEVSVDSRNYRAKRAKSLMQETPNMGVGAKISILLGDGELARDILAELKSCRHVRYDIRQVVAPECEAGGGASLDGVPIRHGFEDLCDFAEAEQVSAIIVALDQKKGVMPYRELLNCKVRGIKIIDGESFFERVTGKLLLEKISPSWFIFSDDLVKSHISRFMKRLVELSLSIAMLILLSPLLVLVAAAIKLDSKGPMLFSQERVGEFGKLFNVYKFRSMREDAEKYCGPAWAEDNDPRITRVGRIIRKLRIDGLPQLWNVLKGDMSFVGPRPESPFFAEKLEQTIPYYSERFVVKPGVTGWAEIKYPYGASEKDALEKLKFDLYYIKNMSVIMDLIVIFHTVKTVLLGRGSR